MWLLLIPPIALLLALVWVGIVSRPPRVRQPHDSIESHHRVMTVLSRTDSVEPDARRRR